MDWQCSRRLVRDRLDTILQMKGTRMAKLLWPSCKCSDYELAPLDKGILPSLNVCVRVCVIFY